MLTENLRVRIAALNRGGLLATASDSPGRRPATLESLVSGQLVRRHGGSFYRVRRSVAEFGSGQVDSAQERKHVGSARDSGSDAELASLACSFPTRAVFLDLETCGFSGSPLFLIGVLRQADGELIVEQLLARNYGEEPAVLAQLWSLLPDYDVLVTFNGKTFDWPFVLDRSSVHRIQPSITCSGASPSSDARRHPARDRTRAGFGGRSLVHCDLLPLARRHWKRPLQLPDCRLQTLESVLCRRHRSGDIPGHLIPPAYHAFVRNGDAQHIRPILHHNALDLLTMAQLATLLTHSGGLLPEPSAGRTAIRDNQPTLEHASGT